MYLTRLAAACLLIPVFATGADPVSANDDKHYPGTFCNVHPDSKHIRKKLLYSQFGKVINSSDETMHIVCPIIKDRNDSNKEIYKIQIVLGNPTNTTRHAKCWIRSVSYNGETVLEQKGGGQLTMHPGQPGALTYWHIDGNAHNNSAYSGSIYVLYCRLGPGVQLGSYFVSEN